MSSLQNVLLPAGLPAPTPPHSAPWLLTAAALGLAVLGIFALTPEPQTADAATPEVPDTEASDLNPASAESVDGFRLDSAALSPAPAAPTADSVLEQSSAAAETVPVPGEPSRVLPSAADSESVAPALPLPPDTAGRP